MDYYLGAILAWISSTSFFIYKMFVLFLSDSMTLRFFYGSSTLLCGFAWRISVIGYLLAFNCACILIVDSFVLFFFRSKASYVLNLPVQENNTLVALDSQACFCFKLERIVGL